MSETAEQQEPNTDLLYSIHLITAEMGGAGSQVYNHIRFRNHLGQDALAFHGVGVPRNIDKSRALRVILAPVQGDGLPSKSFNIVKDVCIFEGSAEQYLQKLACAGDAANFINQQNLTFNPEDENGESPNSICHTLVTAMGLDMPDETQQFWAPGHERIILPTNWRSAYA